MKKTFVSMFFVLSLLAACNSGGADSNSSGGGNSNYLPAGTYVQQNGTMATMLNGNNTPIYSYLCQSEVKYNISINSQGQRCINGGCTTEPILIKQGNCFNSNQNPGTIPGLPGKITSYSDTWNSCQYKSKVLTATRNVTIYATDVNDKPYTLICTGIVTIY